MPYHAWFIQFWGLRQSLYQLNYIPRTPRFIGVMCYTYLCMFNCHPCCHQINPTWGWGAAYVNFLACKQEDLNIDLQHPCKSLV